MLTTERLTSSVRDALRAVTLPPSDLPLAVGDHGRPDLSAAQQADGRYCVLWSIAGGQLTTLGLEAAPSWLEAVYQVDSYGPTRQVAEWMADKVRSVLLGRSGGTWTTVLSSLDRVVIDRRVDSRGGVDREADNLFASRDRYVLVVVPADVAPSQQPMGLNQISDDGWAYLAGVSMTQGQPAEES